MRFDELSLRIPGDELRMRFHERLTVLSGIGALERQGLVEGLLGTLTGTQRHSTVLTYLDSEGRRVTVTRDQDGRLCHVFDADGSPAPDLVAGIGFDADMLRALCCVGPADLGLLAPAAIEARPPELVEAHVALEALTAELDAAMAARREAESLREELYLIDEQVREAEEGRAKRRYARLLADLERVRAEAAALRGGEAGAEADRRFVAAATDTRHLVRRWEQVEQRLSHGQGRFGTRERLDPRTIAEAEAVPDQVPAELEALAAALETAEQRRDRLATRLQGLATDRLPEPSDPAVVRLAGEDQDEIWSIANEVLRTAARVEQVSLELGGLPVEGIVPAIVTDLDAAHSHTEAMALLAEERRIPAAAGISVGGIAAVITMFVLLWLTPAVLVGAVATALWGIVEPKRKLARARGDEDDVLTRAGVPTWLAFHLRRVDPTIDPAVRQRLDLAALQHRVTQTHWHELVGDVDPAAALELESEARSYAGALAGLSGAADEIETVRAELLSDAEPAVERARGALMAACAPFGIDDPTLAVSMVRHQVGLGLTARLQRELEAAEEEETVVRSRLDAQLHDLGFDRGDIRARVVALDQALSAAVEREQARGSTRSRDVIEAELAELEARARREHQAEWGASVAPDTAEEPDVDSLRAQREQTAKEYDAAYTAVPDIEHLADRRSAVERRVTVLEAAMGDSPAAASLADTGDIERYLLARLTSVRNAGPTREQLPLILDEPFLRIRGRRKWELLELVERLAGKAQIVYLSDDPDVLLWSRRQAITGGLLLLEPVAGTTVEV